MSNYIFTNVENVFNLNKCDDYILTKEITESNSDKIVGFITDKQKFHLAQNLIPKIKNLQVFGILANSLKSINIDFLYKKGIKVVNIADSYAKTCSEFLLMLCILGIRKASLSHENMRIGRWGIRSFNGSNVKKVKKNFDNCSLGIIGYSFITRNFLKILKPFNNEIKIYSENISKEEISKLEEVKLCNIDEVINSDIIILARTLNNKTLKFFNKKYIDKIKSGTVLINIARANLIDNDYLFKRLLKNDIFYCVDVFEKEPINKFDRYIRLNNVFLTSHMAGDSEEILNQGYTQIFNNVIQTLNNNYDYHIEYNTYIKNHKK